VQPLDRLQDRVGRCRLDADVLGESLGDHAEANASKSVRRVLDGRDVVRCASLALPGVVLVLAGDRLQQRRQIGRRPGHRAAVVEGLVDPGHADVGHETVCRLQAEHAAPGGGGADGPALVAADGHVDSLVEEGGCRAARRPARRSPVVPGVQRRPVPARLAAAREREIVHVRDRDHLAAGAQKAIGDDAVLGRHVALEDPRPAGERDPGDRDRVLDGDPPPGQHAFEPVAADAAEADDRVQRILAGLGRAAGFTDGVDRSSECRLLRLEQVEGLEDRLGDDEELLGFLGLDGEPPGARQLVQLVGLDARDHLAATRSRTACEPSPRRED
jgi:hypothetical protein